MSERERRSRQSVGFQGYQDGRVHDQNRSMPLHIHPALLEDERDVFDKEMRRINTKNQAIINQNRALQSEVTRKYVEIDRLEQVIPQLQAEKETNIRELIQTGLKLEAELRSMEPLKMEVWQLRAEVESLNTSVEDLTSLVNGLRHEIARVEVENKQVPLMEADIDTMQNELIEARRTFEYEQRAKHDEVQEKQRIENYLVSLRREIEELRAEQLDEGTNEPSLEGGGYQRMDLNPGTQNGDRFSDDYDGER
ncbi:Protein FLX-like 3 [Linum perenne]